MPNPRSTSNPPLVSVCMITYGHEKYIEEAINSVLMQECDFDFEFIISNDCSPDATDSVIRSILKTHPKSSHIEYYEQEKNLGMMPNFLFTLEQCNGFYIALCEGDDFWTDKLKLQKQVDFLRENEDCSLCFHNASVYNEITNQTKLFVNKYHKTFYTAEDILEDWLIPTASMLFVNVLRQNKLPQFFAKVIHGDLALQLFLYEYGNFGLLNENMCTYRINENGATQTIFKEINYKYLFLQQVKEMKIYFNGKYNRFFNKSIVHIYQNLIVYYKATHFLKQIKILFKMITFEPLAVVRYYKEIFASFKIVLHNCLSKIRNKTV